ncbi:hypothetical protein NWF34_10005 [Gordonia sp. GONU]|uniref:hypothetical protein n=1 Tax=Gordonia sp. GONU TaxID=2972949 RepID=UPI0021AC187F|nr:hypothetical protein [Gordonia sp. GONU]MCR8897281.1 hypothetical protein [Gordonia sp. GONU]
MTTIRIDLPWQSPPLTMNDRLHHRAHAREVAAIRRDVHWLAVRHRLPKGVAHVTVQLHWVPATRRRRDPINVLPTQKALVDALTAGTSRNPGYGLVPDDTPDYVTDQMPIIHPPTTARGTVRMWVELTLTEAPA